MKTKYIIVGQTTFRGKTFKGYFTGYSFQKKGAKEYAKIETAEKYMKMFRPFEYRTTTDIRIEPIIITGIESEKRKNTRMIMDAVIAKVKN